MLTQSKHSFTHESHGAVVLRDRLSRSLGAYEHDVLVEQIDFWQAAISGRYKKMNLGKKEQRKSRIIHKWYQREYELHSYEARIPEERFLLRKVKNDPYHYLVNLVEMVARAPIEEMLRSEGIDARVFLASEQDNIISGVDLIIEEQTPDGVRYTGIDIAISINSEYIEEKEKKRIYTTCREFNAHKMHGEKRNMPRQVFAIPPIVMARFLQKYMNGVTANKKMEAHELLSLFSGTHNETTEAVHKKITAKVHTIMHGCP